MQGRRGSCRTGVLSGDCLGTPGLHQRRAFKAPMDSWSQLCGRWLSDISDVSKQTLPHETQMCSVSVLPKTIGGVLVGALAASTKNTPLNGSPGLLLHPELEGARLLFLSPRQHVCWVEGGGMMFILVADCHRVIFCLCASPSLRLHP